jgi:3-deoxy-D-manno-octulosonic-acid transferase
MLSSAYAFATDLAAPFIGLYLYKRRLQGREDAARFNERLGIASRPRPDGQVIWCHAASVGEASSLLALIEKLRTLYPQTHILVTTGTVTSARMLEKRLPPGVIHQYVPVDRISYVQKFIDHWRPDLALWIESELWPNMLQELRRHKIPAALLNGRMSESSFQRWRLVKDWAQNILQTFHICLAQTEAEYARFMGLGAVNVRCVGNLKYAAAPLPYDENALQQLQKIVSARPCWGMMSTHKGEETIALSMHKQLAKKWPDLLTIIVPRHAVRGKDVATLAAQAECTYVRRSQEELAGAQTAIYIADTMGELGLFYRLCPVIVMGGSFVPVGGHNPIEPAQLGAAIIFGPSMDNFTDIAREFVEHNAAIQTQDEDELVAAAEKLLTSSDDRIRIAHAAKVLTDDKRDVLDAIIVSLRPLLESFA